MHKGTLKKLLRKLSEARRHQSDLPNRIDKYKVLFEKSPLAMAYYDSKGVLVECNEQAEKIIGSTSEKMIGFNAVEKMTNELYRGELIKALKGEQGFYEGEYNPVTGNRSLIIRTFFTPINPENPEDGVVSISEDITERKLAQEKLTEYARRLNTLIDNLLGFAYRCAYDPEWTMEYLSEGIFNMTGYPAHEFIGNRVRSFNSIIEPSDRQQVRDNIQKMIAVKRPYILEYRIHASSGSIRWVWEKGRGVFDANGELTALEGFITDITERKQAEQRMLASLQEKEVLLQEIHHRVKNNLQIISSMLNLQTDFIKDKDDLQWIVNSQNRIHTMALIHEHLYQSENITCIRVKDYFSDLIRHFQETFRLAKKKITFTADIEELSLGIDKAIPLGLITNEIMLNSLKHAFPDKKEGTLSLKMYKENDRVIFIIKDNGIGFQNNNSAYSRAGLGIKLIDSLVRQLKGGFEITSEHGLAWKLHFPL
ncbi:MAG: PAS domain S-box protein [Spirochaetota bacterium]